MKQKSKKTLKGLATLMGFIGACLIVVGVIFILRVGKEVVNFLPLMLLLLAIFGLFFTFLEGGRKL